MKKYEKPQAIKMTFKSRNNTNSTTNDKGTLASYVPEGIGSGEYSKLKVFTK